MAVQTLGDSRAAEYMKGKKTLEINPEHAIVQALKQKVDSDAGGAKVRKYVSHDHSPSLGISAWPGQLRRRSASTLILCQATLLLCRDFPCRLTSVGKYCPDLFWEALWLAIRVVLGMTGDLYPILVYAICP